MNCCRINLIKIDEIKIPNCQIIKIEPSSANDLLSHMLFMGHEIESTSDESTSNVMNALKK